MILASRVTALSTAAATVPRRSISTLLSHQRPRALNQQFFCHCPPLLVVWGVCLFQNFAATAHAFSTMSVTERSNDGTIVVSPKNEADQSALVVISHGLGDTAEGFADVAEVRTKEKQAK